MAFVDGLAVYADVERDLTGAPTNLRRRLRELTVGVPGIWTKGFLVASVLGNANERFSMRFELLGPRGEEISSNTSAGEMPPDGKGSVIWEFTAVVINASGTYTFRASTGSNSTQSLIFPIKRRS